MKERILNNWGPLRILYTVLGSIVIVHSIIVREWAGILFGAYFASMGIFSFGCAAGNCGMPYRSRPKNVKTADIDFEEIK